jgi:hypothetical protein
MPGHAIGDPIYLDLRHLHEHRMNVEWRQALIYSQPIDCLDNLRRAGGNRFIERTCENFP